MMRKPLVPRFLLLLAVYAVVFLVIVQLQFAKRSNFTLQSGNLVVSGHYGESGEGVQLPNMYSLKGDVSVFFGGMEFMLTADEGFELSGPGGSIRAAAESMIMTDNGVYFLLSPSNDLYRSDLGEVPELSFTTQYSGGALVLTIRCTFGGIDAEETLDPPEASATSTYTAANLPYKPLRTSRVREEGAAFVLNSDGVDYMFNRNAGDPRRGSLLRFDTDNSVISYQTIPKRNNLGPADFIMAEAGDDEAFEAAVTLWRDKSYSAWNHMASLAEGLNSEVVAAYMSESLRRGTYRASSAAVSAVYAPEPGSYEASAYIGRTDAALRSLSTAERERSARLARVFNEKSLDFLKEFHVVAYLGTRGYSNLLDDVAEMLRTLDPAAMTAEEAAGILEGREDWGRYRPGRENPFYPLVDQAIYVIADSLRKNPQNGTALVFSGDEADTEYNLRLGSALLSHEDETAKALGRTLVLSVLALADTSGSVPRSVVQGSGMGFTENPASADAAGRGSPQEGPLLSSARMYRIYNSSPDIGPVGGSPGRAEYFARAQAINTASAPGLWAWTAAASVYAEQQGGITDITVNFPAGETHYMIIRGVRPFNAIQLYNMNFPTDSQFERYDSSGWIYSVSEQSLLVKMRHRSASEHIRIISAP
jgi:hypothetical protein